MSDEASVYLRRALREILTNGHMMVAGRRITMDDLIIPREEIERIEQEAKAKGMTPREYLTS